MAARVAPPWGVDGSATGWTLTSAVPSRRHAGRGGAAAVRTPGSADSLRASWAGPLPAGGEDLDRVEHPGGHAGVFEGAQCLGGGGGGAQCAGRGLADRYACGRGGER